VVSRGLPPLRRGHGTATVRDCGCARTRHSTRQVETASGAGRRAQASPGVRGRPLRLFPRAYKRSSMRVFPRVLGFTRSRSRNSATPSS
jgi:hypothetical protein